jgi:hypothetical protein
MKTSFLFCCLLLMNLLLSAQTAKVLALTNYHSWKRVSFEPGEGIRLKMKKDPFYYKGRIISVSDSLLILKANVFGTDANGNTWMKDTAILKMKDIHFVYKKSHTNPQFATSFRKFSLILISTGCMMLSLGLKEKSLGLHKSIKTYLGWGFISIPLIIAPFRINKYRIGRAWIATANVPIL